MSADNEGNTQTTTTQIPNQFDTDVSEENARIYTNLESKSEIIRSVIGFIVVIPLIVAVLDIITLIYLV